MYKVLCVDESEDTLHAICFSLAGHFDVHSCKNPRVAISLAEELSPEIILLNPVIKAENFSIGKLVPNLVALDHKPCLIMLSHFTYPWLIDFTRDLGAAGFISKPWSEKWLLLKINKLYARWCEKEQAMLQDRAARAQLPTASTFVEEHKKKRYIGAAVQIVGSSVKMEATREVLWRFSLSDKTVLLRGETGTGKDLAARYIHEHSNQAKGPFVIRNVGAIPDTLLAAELFGCEKGAYTDAMPRQGCMGEASGGTLFLDEIGEASPLFQTTLLRVIDSGDYQQLGSNKSRKANFRLICATNKSLSAMVSDGGFRQDLWHRLNMLAVRMPSLREHSADVPELFDYWCRKEGARANMFLPEVFEWLQGQHWQGNVREFNNMLSRVWVLYGVHGTRIGVKQLQESAFTETSV